MKQSIFYLDYVWYGISLIAILNVCLYVLYRLFWKRHSILAATVLGVGRKLGWVAYAGVGWLFLFPIVNTVLRNDCNDCFQYLPLLLMLVVVVVSVVIYWLMLKLYGLQNSGSFRDDGVSYGVVFFKKIILGCGLNQAFLDENKFKISMVRSLMVFQLLIFISLFLVILW